MPMKIFFYQRKIDDWRRKTSRLSLQQRGIYSEIIDWYYCTGGDMPSNVDEVCRMIGATKRREREDVELILNNPKLFSIEGIKLVQKMCDETIDFITRKSSKASASAKSKYNKNKDLSERTQSDGSANYKLSTNNYSNVSPSDLQARQVGSGFGFDPPEGPEKTKKKEPDVELVLFEKFWEAFPRQRRGSREKTLAAYRNALTRTTEGEINEAVIKYVGSDEVKRGFAKGAAAWLNDDRWTVDYSVKPQAGAAQGRPTYGDIVQNATRRVLDKIQRDREIWEKVD